ncbi:hypothetical protein INR75_06880 [Zunongwangia sp. SCSIO 43204]|uniref:hypothetical protein n=1 Tax=Zunongwangia sp. SCSIO 43204 TaxID=2779359 RepID=UPI001CA9E90B|nr:hypothetical protein [Zunongwangia sp. SCSIO 43204]UAB85732.1 hypothetical protein INR75_06880 [Zunongwangia sp. SCSIO 43204]
MSIFGFSQPLKAQKNYPIVQIEDFHQNGNLKTQKVFNTEKYINSGKLVLEDYMEYYNNQQVRLKFTIKENKLDGELVAYWNNGNLKRKDLYKEGKLIEGKMWDKHGKEISHSKFEIKSILKS